MGDPVNGRQIVLAEGKKMEMAVSVQMKVSDQPEYNAGKKEILVKFDRNYLTEIRNVRLDWEFINSENKPLLISDVNKYTMRKNKDSYYISNASPPIRDSSNRRITFDWTLKKIMIKTSVCNDIIYEIK